MRSMMEPIYWKYLWIGFMLPMPPVKTAGIRISVCFLAVYIRKDVAKPFVLMFIYGKDF